MTMNADSKKAEASRVEEAFRLYGKGPRNIVVLLDVARDEAVSPEGRRAVVQKIVFEAQGVASRGTIKAQEEAASMFAVAAIEAEWGRRDTQCACEDNYEDPTEDPNFVGFSKLEKQAVDGFVNVLTGLVGRKNPDGKVSVILKCEARKHFAQVLHTFGR